MEMKPVPYWHFDALAGAGAIRSTASDLLRFLDDQIDPSKTPLADAIKASHEIHYRNPQGLALALAWHVISLPDSTRLFWHNGGTGGFRSFIAFAPDKRAGVVLLANAGLPLDQFTQFAIGVARAALKE
jgi:CubicO group peptidase (beta-lactamase class C family)